MPDANELDHLRRLAEEARSMAMEAKAIAVTHQQGCERAYAENQRRLTSIENKTDAQTVKLDAIQDRAGKRYWATMATAVTLAVTVGWQIFVYLHPHVG